MNTNIIHTMKKFHLILSFFFITTCSMFGQGLVTRSASRVVAARAKVEKKKPAPAKSSTSKPVTTTTTQAQPIKSNTLTGFDHYLAEAQKGDVDCQYYVACCYDEGADGVSEDLEKAKTWFVKAAQQGHVEAMAALGDYFGDEGDCRLCIYWYEKAAKGGSVDAISSLGHEYLYGGCVEVNYEQAVKYLQIGAEKGDVFATFDYGYCLYYGCGVTQNRQSAELMFNKAKQALLPIGVNPAHYSTMKAPQNISSKNSKTVQQPQAVTQQSLSARDWFLLGLKIYSKSKSNQEEALSYFKKAAEMGYDYAQELIKNIGSSKFKLDKALKLEVQFWTYKEKERDKEMYKK